MIYTLAILYDLTWNNRLVQNWERSISRLYIYCHPAYLTQMQSTSCKMLSWINHSWNQDFLEKYQQPQIGKNTRVGSCSLLQGVFPTQRPNTGLLQCRRILYHLNYQGSPRILQWVVYPFSRGSSQSRG